MASRHFLDRPTARVLAGLVCVFCLAALVYLERERLWPGAAVATAANDPFGRCFAERSAQIDRMLAEEVIEAAQADLFRARAEAMCRAETEKGGVPPLPERQP